MGMPIVVDVRDEHVDAVARVYAWFRHVDATFSTFKPESEISRIARGELRPEEADPDVRRVLARCEELRVETGGYFDAAAGTAGKLDPAGLVKGWSVDRAAAILDEAGVQDYAVNAGGDMRLCGRAVPKPCWRVGIQHPLDRSHVAAVVEANNLALATSGAYARGDHVLDPHSGMPPAGVLSVTICGPDLATADAYATAAFAMGTSGPAWTARLEDYEALTILSDQTVHITAGFPVTRPVGQACVRRPRRGCRARPRRAVHRPCR
jgi:thiamine biosynthesis lipoprotein